MDKKDREDSLVLGDGEAGSSKCREQQFSSMDNADMFCNWKIPFSQIHDKSLVDHSLVNAGL
jgi:hypothetical protein